MSLKFCTFLVKRLTRVNIRLSQFNPLLAHTLTLVLDRDLVLAPSLHVVGTVLALVHLRAGALVIDRLSVARARQRRNFWALVLAI